MNHSIETIKINGTIGDANNYTIYNVDRAVTIQGLGNAKVFGTFMVKADGVTIQELAIENQGDVGGNQLPNPQVRGNIVVYAKNVTIKNNTLTHGLGDKEGLANAIQIFSNVANNPLSNYVIEDNTIEGFNNSARGSSSAAILIAEGYKSTVIGGLFAKKITAEDSDYEYLLKNTLQDNTINLEHSDWSSGSGVLLYPVEDTKE